MPEVSKSLKSSKRARVLRSQLSQMRRRAIRHDRIRTVDLDGLPQHLGYLLRRAQVAVFQDFLNTVRPANVRPAQYSILTVIHANPGLTQMALAHALGIERSRLVHLLDGLEARRFVQRVPSKVDRRSHALHLTSEGQTALRQIKELAVQHEKNVAEKLGPERRKALLKLLSIFVHG